MLDIMNDFTFGELTFHADTQNCKGITSLILGARKYFNLKTNLRDKSAAQVLFSSIKKINVRNLRLTF